MAAAPCRRGRRARQTQPGQRPGRRRVDRGARRADCFVEGTIGLATSGSGDTLGGVIAGLLARGSAAAQAAVWGVYLHGRAGHVLTARMGRVGLLAREVLAEIPPLMAEFDE